MNTIEWALLIMLALWCGYWILVAAIGCGELLLDIFTVILMYILGDENE